MQYFLLVAVFAKEKKLFDIPSNHLLTIDLVHLCILRGCMEFWQPRKKR